MSAATDVVSQARHRLAELEWTRRELQATQAATRMRVKVRRADAPRHGRRGQVAAACPDEINLLRKLHDDLRKINEQISELRAWIGEQATGC